MAHRSDSFKGETALYIVRDPRSPGGRTVVRRPLPPPTATTPLPDDFDAVTLPTLSGWSRSRRARRPEGHANGDAPSTEPRASTSYDHAPSNYSRQRKSPDIPKTKKGRTKKRGPGDAYERTEEYLFYGDMGGWSAEGLDEAEVRAAMMNGGGVEVEAELPQVAGASSGYSMGARVLQPRRVSNGVPTGIGTPDSLDERERRLRKGKGKQLTSPSASVAETGEEGMVEQRVLEDGPERTVSIWRVETARSDLRGQSERDSPDRRTRLNVLKEQGRKQESAEPERKRPVMRDKGNRAYPTPPTTNSTPGSRMRVMSVAIESDWGRPQATSTPPPIHHRPRQRVSSPTTGVSSMETILSSSSPSLLHLAPMLKTLGVHSIAHLRAIGKMSGALRDREIKQEAMRCGMSVVEWAILLNMIEQL